MNRVKGFTIREEIKALIRENDPEFSDDSDISEDLLSQYKLKYAKLLAPGLMAGHVHNHDIISDNYLQDDLEELTFVDKVANFASSYSFGIFLLALVAVWAAYNYKDGFDIYPFNLLDLVLGLIASLQALFIMISQNKSAKFDKKRSEATYHISLKNELEINILREKIDHIKDVQNVHFYDELKKLKEA